MTFPFLRVGNPRSAPALVGVRTIRTADCRRGPKRNEPRDAMVTGPVELTFYVIGSRRTRTERLGPSRDR